MSTREFPLKTVITKVELVSLEDPVDLTVTNLPSWRGELAARTCFSNTRPAGISFAHTFSEDKEIVTVLLSPVEVMNCAEGRFRLYKTINYRIEYIPYSPVLINYVDAPQEVIPQDNTYVSVYVSKTQNQDVTGDLILKDALGNMVVRQAASTQYPQHTLQFIAPEKEGIYDYTIEFVQDEDSKTKTSFSLKAVLVDKALLIPDIVSNGQITMQLKVANAQQQDVPLTYSYYLLKNNALLQSGTSSEVLQKGIINVLLYD